MAALVFANALQGGESQSFAQALDSIKRVFHLTDAVIGVTGFVGSVTGALASIPVALVCIRHKRTRVLAWMFAAWTALVGLSGLSRTLHPFGSLIAINGFVILASVRVVKGLFESTDPPVYSLITDWWPLGERSGKISIFSAGAAIGGFFGLVAAGVLVDNVGWQWAFYMWVPLGFVGTLLMFSRREPRRGLQDAAFEETLEELAEREGQRSEVVSPSDVGPTLLADTKWEMVRQIVRVRSWIMVCVGLGVAMIMQNGISFWGTPYFKRTFHLSGTKVAGIVPVIGVGVFAGIIAGGFVADRLLSRGVLRARVWVSAVGYIGAGIVYVFAFTTRSLAVAVPLLGVAATLSTIPTGPQYAVLMDVISPQLRPQAASVANIVQLISSVGGPIVGLISTALGENLRLALLCVSPMYVLGGVIVLLAQRSYVHDLSTVVAEASREVG